MVRNKLLGLDNVTFSKTPVGFIFQNAPVGFVYFSITVMSPYGFVFTAFQEISGSDLPFIVFRVLQPAQSTYHSEINPP